MLPINVTTWLDENKSQFHPPVCNKMMSDDFMKIMFVGGPNSRKDYHLDQGEEFFLMLKGDMLLKVMERGTPKDIHIREGEVFRLPPRIPHSPQRLENTVGLVIERQRTMDEWDGLRYYCEDGTTILWQQFFHLQSLVQDLPPVFKEYFSSQQYKTGVPISGTTGNEMGDEPGKFVVDKTTVLGDPFSLESWITKHRSEIDGGSGKVLFGVGEFNIVVYGKGKHIFKDEREMWYWQRQGTGTLSWDDSSKVCNKDEAIMIEAGSECTLHVEEGGYGILVKMDPKGNLPKE